MNTTRSTSPLQCSTDCESSYWTLFCLETKTIFDFIFRKGHFLTFWKKTHVKKHCFPMGNHNVVMQMACFYTFKKCATMRTARMLCFFFDISNQKRKRKLRGACAFTAPSCVGSYAPRRSLGSYYLKWFLFELELTKDSNRSPGSEMSKNTMT